MPDQEELDAWEFEQKNPNASLMNDRLYNFLCLNLKGEALAMVTTSSKKKKLQGRIFKTGLLFFF